MAGFRTILVANRGEIALRVIRTARDLGYGTVAVFSDADRDAPHVAAADRAVRIGPPPSAQSYLDIAAVIAAARLAGADAVHPGYGFLSENADFAAACAAAGLVFIGPPVEAIRLMGNKRLAKLRMAEAGVPTVPGYSGADQHDARLLAEIERIGRPVMVKAAAGGGGRGMRRLAEGDDAAAGLAAARAEALAAFGSDELILEQAVSAGRHVEVQVFADAHGNVLHLHERDCSVQRRHQKVVEEAPSPALDGHLRARMGEAAVAAAQAVGYVGAGTVEFMLDDRGRFYFLEMNTRLQVEHPVTEMVTGIDLVAWQIDVAAGRPLPLAQADVPLVGHAIEVRLYAEDPAQGFLPQAGRVAAWRPPEGAGIRVDAGIVEGQSITPFYDPMLAKVIAHGRTREEARRRLVAALGRTRVAGLATNRAFLVDLLEHPVFAAGRATTDWLESATDLAAGRPASPAVLATAAALIYARSTGGGEDWRSAMPVMAPLAMAVGPARHACVVEPSPGGRARVRVGDGPVVDLRIEGGPAGGFRVEIDGLVRPGFAAWDGDRLDLDLDGEALAAAEAGPEARAGRAADGRLLAPMAGRIVAVRAAVGDRVGQGAVIVVLEAMKMQHEVRSTLDGTVASLSVAPDDQVEARRLLAEIVPPAD